MSDNLTGKTLGNYQITECVARTPLTEVYRANQPQLKRTVAVKRLLPHIAQIPGVVDAFSRAVRGAVLLQHLAIERVYEYGNVNGIPFKAMEYIQGITLSALLTELATQRLLLPLPVVGIIVAQVAQGLTFAYEQEQNPLHRGISAANIMIRVKDDAPDDIQLFLTTIKPSDVVLTDYGVARVLHDAVQHATPDSVPGIADYTAPEICQGKKGDGRADVYALGVVLYQMLTGILPFRAGTPSQVMQAHINEPVVSPRTVRPDITEQTERIVLKALTKNLNDRFFDAEAFGLAAKESLGQMTTSVRCTPMPNTITVTPSTSVAPVAPTLAAPTVVASTPAAPTRVAPAKQPGSSFVKPTIGAARPPIEATPPPNKQHKQTSKKSDKSDTTRGKKKQGGGISAMLPIVFVVIVMIAAIVAILWLFA